MDATRYLIRICASGGMERTAVEAGAVPQEQLQMLLHTDALERYRVPVRPEFPDTDRALCYLIDARSGDRELPMNFIGTCFYHTGCPVCGDLLLGFSGADADGTEIFGLTKVQSDLLLSWLHAQFPAFPES